MPMNANNNIEQNTQTDSTASGLSHLDSDGDINMVDVSGKTVTTRRPTPQGKYVFQKVSIRKSKLPMAWPRRVVLLKPRILPVLWRPSVHELIPLCHPLPLDKIGLTFDYDDSIHAITVTATVKVTHKTGVEMEALTAVSIACLTLYDMTKALSHDIVIDDIRLITKTGGKSDYNGPSI